MKYSGHHEGEAVAASCPVPFVSVSGGQKYLMNYA